METMKVLAVDDVAGNLLVMEELLRGEGVDVITASSGQEALKLLMSHDIALILLDVQMPGMDGFEVAELVRARAKTRHIPIIFVTAISTDQQYVFKGYETGAVDYLFKPVDPVILTSKVSIFAELHRQKTALQSTIDELKRAQDALTEANRKLSDLSMLDGLTGVYNRRKFDETIVIEMKRAKREHAPVSVVMMDIDFFKPYNDTYGHQAGDECLRSVARTLEESLRRPSDMLARYGGEEFVAILPATDEKGAQHIAERMRESVERMNMVHIGNLNEGIVTVSVGFATMNEGENMDPAVLIKYADEALYTAKKSGRNRTVAYSMI